MFKQERSQSLLEMMKIDLIIGSGGVLSHAPDRRSSALMLIDAYEPVGVTELAVDSIFMLPHLGVFSEVHPEAAAEIFIKDCLVRLGTVIEPLGAAKTGVPVLELSFRGKKAALKAGEIRRFELKEGEAEEVDLRPLGGRIDVGAGGGMRLTVSVRGGHAGLIIDCRGRPLVFKSGAREKMAEVSRSLECFGLRAN